MAPAGILDRLKAFYTGEEVKDVPAISVALAAGMLALYTIVYVAPFYTSASTRPSATLSRDAPSVIRGRITSVSWSCAICSISTFALLSSVDKGSPIRSLHNMGYFPLGFLETAKCMALTCLLFLGPLFEAGVAEGEWRNWIRLRNLHSIFSSWITYRNLVAGPVTEEILFRSSAVPLFVLARASLPTILVGTPLIFGLAHAHHFYEYRLTHPNAPLTSAILRSAFQLIYTTLFGAYATFLYLRTGSLLAVVLVHSFCNYMGLPRVWGRVESGAEMMIGPDGGDDWQKRTEETGPRNAPARPGDLSFSWTIVYYVLLVVGAFAWVKTLWYLTESKSALMTF